MAKVQAETNFKKIPYGNTIGESGNSGGRSKN